MIYDVSFIKKYIWYMELDNIILTNAMHFMCSVFYFSFWCNRILFLFFINKSNNFRKKNNYNILLINVNLSE